MHKAVKQAARVTAIVVLFLFVGAILFTLLVTTSMDHVEDEPTIEPYQ